MPKLIKDDPTSSDVHVDTIMDSTRKKQRRLKKRKMLMEEALKKGLSQWFDEKWVDISRPKKGGGFEPCGRDDAKSGKYPKCVPAARASRMTPAQIESAVNRKRKAEASENREGKKPIMVETVKKESKNVPTNPELYARVKTATKAKFDVYPSAYANAWLVAEYKRRGGKYKVSKGEGVGHPFRGNQHTKVVNAHTESIVNQLKDKAGEEVANKLKPLVHASLEVLHGGGRSDEPILVNGKQVSMGDTVVTSGDFLNMIADELGVGSVTQGMSFDTMTETFKKADKPLKNPKGGLTQAGRDKYNRETGSKLKRGVTGAADTPEKMRRKGSFLTRFFTNPSGPMINPNGEPTRLALSAAAWGEPVPKNRSDAARLAAKGRNLLDRYEANKVKKGESAGHPFRGNQWTENVGISQSKKEETSSIKVKKLTPKPIKKSELEKMLRISLDKRNSAGGAGWDMGDAVRDWKSNLSEKINATLRKNSSGSKKIQETIKSLDLCFAKVSAKLPTDSVLYRGMDYPKGTKLVVGQVLTEKGFQATTISKDMAESYVADSMLVIHAPKGTKVLPVGKSTFVNGETGREMKVDLGQLVLNRGTKYVITSVEEYEGNKKIGKITVQVVP